MANDFILTIDNGTQSVRALVFDRTGNLIEKSQVKLTAYESAEPGWMEHDVDGLWQELCRACTNLWDKGTVRPNDMSGLVVTTQRATVINLDADGTPLRPAIIWADQRQAEARAKYPLMWSVLFRTLGLTDTIQAFEKESEANWIAQNQADIWDRTAKFLLLSGYLHYRFTGQYIDSIANQVGYVPFDFKSQTWAADRDWKWSAVPFLREMLPDLVSVGETVGQVTKDAAKETGIPEGLPVIAGASDKACEVLGCGVRKPDVAAISCGTSATINAVTPRYVEPRPFIPPYPAAIPGKYNIEIQVTRGFWMVSWFTEEFGLLESQRADQEGTTAEAYFDELVEATPPGAHGLMLQPFWNPGVREPGPEARGTIIGFTDTHKRAHLYRAIIEGLAYALREGKERIEKRSKTRFKELRIAGGGSQSDAVMQTFADVFDLPAARPSLYEASGLGAAIIGSVALGVHRDFDTAVSSMTSKGRTFTPVASNARLYDRLYTDVYSKLYARMHPVYQTMHHLLKDA